MSRILYRPKLKRGIFENKRFVIVSKALGKLSREKWRLFLMFHSCSSFQEQFIRNDVSLIQKQASQRQKYSLLIVLSRGIKCFFSTCKGKSVKNLLSRSLANSTLSSLELRLDLCLMRSCLAKTLHQARWFIFSGFVFVNCLCIKSSSHQLSKGDFVKITQKMNSSGFNEFSFLLPPNFLEVNYEISGFVTRGRQGLGVYSADLDPIIVG